MRFFAAAAILVAGVTARVTEDVDDCVKSVLSGFDASSMEDLCNNSDSIATLSSAIADQCGESAANNRPADLCARFAAPALAPARHLSHPMERVTEKRAYAPPADASRQVVYLTKTEYACNAKSTPVDPMHVSQIPVQVPAPSSMAKSMGNMAGVATPSYSNGVLVAATSSAVYGSQISAATPTPLWR
ncbi:hypothetical protein N7470_002329 [Penicillium chermesinum]|nr:hypothetical protein N7470_002329 [Penicillium chermesinum]